MPSNSTMLLMVLTMALVTYVIRMIPLTFFNKKIKSRYLKSVLYYIPYAVLSAMTFPAILYSTGNIYTAIFGSVVALVLAFFNRSLLLVAICSCLAVLGLGFII